MQKALKLETETYFFLMLMRALCDARRSGDAVALFEAKDEMEVFVTYTAHPGLKARAERALAGL